MFMCQICIIQYHKAKILYFTFNYAYKWTIGNNKNNGYHTFDSYRPAQS